MGTEEEETISMEHYAMLEVVDCPTQNCSFYFCICCYAVLNPILSIFEDAFRLHDTKGNGFLTKDDLRR